MSIMYTTVVKYLPTYLRSSNKLYSSPVVSMLRCSHLKSLAQPDVQLNFEERVPKLGSDYAAFQFNEKESLFSQAKPELRENEVEASKDVNSKDTEGKPTFDKLLAVQKELVDSLVNLFAKPMNYKIYRQDLLFIDNIRGKRTTGLYPYIQQVALLRTIGHLKFAFVKFVILNTDISKEEGRITIRWRIVGISAFQNVMERQGTWYDGVSYFDVDSKGLIFQHVADKLMADKDKEVVKSPKTALAASLGFGVAVQFPGSSLILSKPSNISNSSTSST